MSAAHHATELSDARPPRASPEARLKRLLQDLPARVIFGALLAVAAAAATFAGVSAFAIFVGIGALFAAREWHRMVGTERYACEVVVAGMAITGAVVAGVLARPVGVPLAILGAGAALAAAAGALRGARPVLNGFGTLYIGIPAYALVALRMHGGVGQWIVLGVFLTVWTADTGALLAGRMLAGPKLLPALSPNKTWSGLGGGLVLPAVVAAGYVSALGGHAWRGVAIGLALAVAGHAGDLFESWIKRRVGRKNSGELIPGHGGMLDRIDSTLSVAPLAALLFHYVDPVRFFGVLS